MNFLIHKITRKTLKKLTLLKVSFLSVSSSGVPPEVSSRPPHLVSSVLEMLRVEDGIGFRIKGVPRSCRGAAFAVGAHAVTAALARERMTSRTSNLESLTLVYKF